MACLQCVVIAYQYHEREDRWALLALSLLRTARLLRLYRLIKVNFPASIARTVLCHHLWPFPWSQPHPLSLVKHIAAYCCRPVEAYKQTLAAQYSPKFSVVAREVWQAFDCHALRST